MIDFTIAVRLNFKKNAGGRYALLLSLLLCKVTISGIRNPPVVGFIIQVTHAPLPESKKTETK